MYVCLYIFKDAGLFCNINKTMSTRIIFHNDEKEITKSEFDRQLQNQGGRYGCCFFLAPFLYMY